MLFRRTINTTGIVEGENRTTFEKSETIGIAGYGFRIETKERYWRGYSGKMEDMPGFFMEGHVALTDCPKDATNLEMYAAENGVVLATYKKETTCEPDGYAKLYHRAVVGDVMEDYSKYLREIPLKIGNLLEKTT
jgi:hypothetical protein